VITSRKPFVVQQGRDPDEITFKYIWNHGRDDSQQFPRYSTVLLVLCDIINQLRKNLRIGDRQTDPLNENREHFQGGR